jgi:5-methyltetrahydrofolate--homocysteine methyltransferase
MDSIQEIAHYLKMGQTTKVRELTYVAIEQGICSSDILEELLSCMKDIRVKFKNNEVYVPEVLIVSRAFNMALEVMEPFLEPSKIHLLGTVVIGTVEGDLHDIGKNLVKMLLKSVGFHVVDIGVNVTPEAFASAVVEHKAQILAISALLTTTMPKIKETVELLVRKRIREQVYIIIGGAPVTSDFAREIGADGYATDAGSAIELLLSAKDKEK